MRYWLTTFTSVLVTSICGACASDSANREPASYEQLKQQELDAERQEFIRETQNEIDEVSHEINQLSEKIDRKQGASADEQASWSQELFELRQERDRLEAELSRAQTVSASEWKEMRGNVGVATDSLQAAVAKLSNEVAGAFSSDEQAEEAASPSTQTGLCQLGVPGVDVELEDEQDWVAVVLTTDQQHHVPRLQADAQALAQHDNYPEDSSASQPNTGASTSDQAGKSPASTDMEPSTQGTAQPSQTASQLEGFAVSVTTRELDNGVRLQFVSRDGRLEQLQSRLERDADRLDDGQCASSSTVSMRQP